MKSSRDYSAGQGTRHKRWSLPPRALQGRRLLPFIAAWDAGLLKRADPKTLKLDSLISIIGDRDPAIFDGETWLMFCAAWPEWDYAWANAKPGLLAR